MARLLSSPGDTSVADIAMYSKHDIAGEVKTIVMMIL
jgi:hypothetical protein